MLYGWQKGSANLENIPKLGMLYSS
jgi:hypothetical protein